MSRASVRSVVPVGLILAAFLFGALDTAAAQGRGNGGGGDTSAPTGTATGWIEQFSDSIAGIESRGWGIEQTGSPDSLFGVPGAGVAKSYQRSNVEIKSDDGIHPGGILSLHLFLGYISGLLTSKGSLVYTKQKYGFGTYEWCMRMSSTSDSPAGAGALASGGVSAGFSYVNNSQTEIDFEQSRAPDGIGNPYWWLYVSNWFNRRLTYDAILADPSVASSTFSDIAAKFRAYKFVWTKSDIKFYVDNNLVKTHTTNVPTASAYVIVNHWGTNNPTEIGRAHV